MTRREVLEKKKGQGMKTPKEIIGELAGYASLCWQPRPTGVFDSTEASKAVDQALSALRECVLAKKITRSCPYSNIKCCTMQDYSKNQALQDIANLFGDEK